MENSFTQQNWLDWYLIEVNPIKSYDANIDGLILSVAYLTYATL